jgi:hypothetical protein
MADSLPELIVADVAAWRAWLGANHAQQSGVWLVLAKKGASEPTTLAYDQALEEALCHGWIDGQTGRRDERSYRQRFTPRRARSAWSERNVGIAERLLGEQRMQRAGLDAIALAKRDGRWQSAYPGQRSIEVRAAGRPGDVRDPHRAEPLCGALSDPRRQAKGHPRPTHRAVRHDARARRDRPSAKALAGGLTGRASSRREAVSA